MRDGSADVAAANPGTSAQLLADPGEADTLGGMHDGAGSERVATSETLEEPLRDIDRLYAYAAWMLGDRGEALKALKLAMADPIPPGARFKDRLHGLRAVVLQRMHSSRKVSQWDKQHHLDELLRKGTSISMPLQHPLLKGDVRRLPVLLSGFMQSCLIAAVQTLAPAVREAFVLLVILGLSDAEVRETFDVEESTLSSYKSRMMKGLEAYFDPRCSHLDRKNPCRCDRRLLIALEQGFVALPEHEVASADYPYGVYLNTRRLFEVLPPLRLNAETVAGLERAS